MVWAVRWAACTVVCFTLACGSGESPADSGPPGAGVDAGRSYDFTRDVGSQPAYCPTEVVDNLAWRETPRADDPFFADVADPSALCPPARIRHHITPDGCAWLDIISSAPCMYVTMDQGLQSAVAKGDRIRVRLWHFPITVPGTFHVRLAIGDPAEVVWEEQVQAPFPDAKLYVDVFDAPADWPAGTPVFWHIQNHGTNSFELVDLVRQ